MCYGDDCMRYAVKYTTVAISMIKSHSGQHGLTEVIGYGCIISEHNYVKRS